MQRCAACSQKTYPVPHPDRIPLVLQGLSADAVRALRPCCLHQGDVVTTSQHGYRMTTRVSEISWDPRRVEQKIDDLPGDMRGRATEALQYLLASPTSQTYQQIVAEHHRWLQREDREASRFWGWTGLFRSSLECVLWPQLYFRDDWADNPVGADAGDANEEGDEEPDVAANKRWSTKRAFAFKVLSPVLDFAMDYSLAVFVYDRWFLKTSTGAGNSSRCTLHRALAQKALGQAWLDRLRHVMSDFHRQHGWADYFVTLSPFELSTPMSLIVEETMHATGRHVRSLPALVLHHVLHAAVQLVKGYLLGHGDKRWPLQVFCDKTAPNAAENVVAWAVRQELQSGDRVQQDFRREEAPHRRQARKGVHWHIAIWVRSRDAVDFKGTVRADMGNTARLRAIVPRVQKSHEPLYRLPREVPTTAIQLPGKPTRHLLHYPAAAHAIGVRPYEGRIVAALAAHMDVQEVVDSAGVAQYMAKLAAYVTKTETKHHEVLARRDKNYLHQAFLYLKHARPVESAMWGTLLGHKSMLVSHAVKAVDLPTFASFRSDVTYQKFVVSPWRDEYPTYAAWLRRMRHTLPEPRPYLRGVRVVLALNFCSAWRPDFWEQWLMCFTPLDQCVENLWTPVYANLPEDLRGFAYCLYHHPDVWGSDAGSENELALQSYSGHALRNLAAHVRSSRLAVRLWQEGRLWRDSGNAVEPPALGNATIGQRVAWARIATQWRLRGDGDDFNLENVDRYRALCIRGPAGTGKSYVLVDAARKLNLEGARVAITSFTALVAEHYRASCPFASCDTVHGLIRFGPTTRTGDAAAKLLAYDVVIVDEIFMLPLPVFDALMDAWVCIERSPLFVFAGDEGQLQPFDEDGGVACSVLTSRHWWMVDEVKLEEPMRANNALWELQERLRVCPPGPETLQDIVRGRLWHRGPRTAQSMRDLFMVHAATTVICISRSAVSDFNTLAQLGLLGPPTEDVPRRRFDERDLPLVFVQAGLRVMLTHNLAKTRGLVNGARGTISEVHAEGIVVDFAHGPEVVRPIYGADGARYPLSRAYACTLHKVQGLTLQHICIVPDVNNVPGAAYVAISRVRSLDDLVWYTYPSRSFFRPSIS